MCVCEHIVQALSTDPTIGGILRPLKGVDRTAAAKKGRMLRHVRAHERTATMKATPPPGRRRRHPHPHAPAGDPSVRQDYLQASSAGVTWNLWKLGKLCVHLLLLQH